MAGKKERQRKLARERYERRQVRQVQRDKRTRQRVLAATAAIVVIGLTVGGILFASRSTGSSATPAATPSATASPTPSPTPSTVAEPATHCTYLANPPAARKVTFPATANSGNMPCNCSTASR